MYAKIRQTFYGFTDNVPDLTIITVIPTVYRQLEEQVERPITSRGWWRCCRGLYNNTDILLAEAPQCSGAADAAKALHAKYAVFVGYCGSLNASYPVGSVVFAKRAIRNDCVRESALEIDLPQVSTGEVGSLLGENYNNMTCDVVDMETFRFYDAARKTSKFGSFMLVTDMPLVPGRRFFEIDTDETRRNTVRLTTELYRYLKLASMSP
ncbi:MAG: hypothetical protein AABX14_04820 [Candidatus Aenigmatarchaeota archaeon]